MIDTILTVVFVLVAIAMVAMILMQRGAGAQAGSGFGGGASATVFGARGSANFLSSSTKWLAVVFFVLSLFMSWKAVHLAAPAQEAVDAGVMSSVPATPDSKPAPVVPGAPASAVPAVPAPAAPVLAPQAVPAAAPQAQPETSTQEGSKGG